MLFDKEWVSWSDWLGFDKVTYLSYEELSFHAQSLGLKSQAEWNEYANSEQFPKNIPKAPQVVYKEWIAWGNFLGTYEFDPISHKFVFCDYEVAKQIAIDLDIKNPKAWYAASKAGLLASNVPSAPNETYKDNGWTGWSDFLGNRQYLSFEEARNYAWSLGFTKKSQWDANKENLPENIPRTPQKVYKNKGWADWHNWLGHRQFLPFKEARNYARSLGFSGTKEWFNFAERPKNIPKYPNKDYKNKGWIDWFDWLGK